MRRIRGEIVLPGDSPAAAAGLVLAEVRDVSLMDMPSTVVAEWRRSDVAVVPGGRIPFDLEVPEVQQGRSLSLRAHVSFDGSGVLRPGDLLTVTVIPVSPMGEVGSIEVPTAVI